MEETSNLTRIIFQPSQIMHSNYIHKGFYNDIDYRQTMTNLDLIQINEITQEEDGDYVSAINLLEGECSTFALALEETLGYETFLIENSDGMPSFHAFCQKNIENHLFFIDARGATTDFEEFFEIIFPAFIHGPFTVRPVKNNDKEEWRKTDHYNDYHDAAIRLINEHMNYYQLDIDN